MKAGDIKKCLAHAIDAEGRDQLDPEKFHIHDNYILSVMSAYKKGESAEYIKILVDALITTEELTVHRRIAVLRLIRDVLSELAKPSVTPEDRSRIRFLLTAYFI